MLGDFLRKREGGMKTWWCRVGRRKAGKRLVAGLITGAGVSLLILALTPHPTPEVFRLRHLHQEDDDYTAPKVLPYETLRSASEFNNESYSLPVLTNPGKDVGVGHVELVSGGSYRNSMEKKHSQAAAALIAHDKPYKQPIQSTPQGNTKSNESKKPLHMVDIPKAPKTAEQLAKARETALTAMQHGYKLTNLQKSLLDQMKPSERKELESKVSKMRLLQEKAYLEQLRKRKQVKKIPGGGEYVISSPQMPVRFPGSLKKIHPSKWPEMYGIMKNLTHYPWQTDPKCSNYSTVFYPVNGLPTAGLASFPSSGNTWIRYLIESATGILTGSLYDDSSLTRKGMYGEGVVYDSGMTILQKSHGYTTGDAMKLDHYERVDKNHLEELSHQGVVVIRNPFKALVSHRNLDVGGHTGYAPKAHFMGKGWADFVTLKIKLWKDFYIDWLTLCRPEKVHITYYEIMKEDPVKEMKDILEYLKLPPDAGRLKCVGQHTDGLFKRKPNKNNHNPEDPYSQQLRDLIYEAIDDVNDILKQKGRKLLPLEKYEMY
ncbi:unnamed protein product, partial [Meganyctiphanes norvegica]